MNLYSHDCSYLFTEYGRRKSQECYDIEAREKEKAINDLSACNAQADGEQEGNVAVIPCHRPAGNKEKPGLISVV